MQAIDAVCDLFRGQEVCRTEFTVTRDRLDPQQSLAFAESDLGVGNRLTLLDDEILANLEGHPASKRTAAVRVIWTPATLPWRWRPARARPTSILRTIFELNKRYGFTKFVIVVPSIAIKEGVYKSLQMTHDHFRTLYSGVPRSSTSFTTRRSSARSAISPPALKSRSWW